MTRFLVTASLGFFLLPVARAEDPRCRRVEDTTQKACTEAAPREKRGSQPFEFHQALCESARRVARKACDQGMFFGRYDGSCEMEAEFVRDATSEACRIALYREPKPFVKVWFKMYDERCRKNARESQKRATRLLCGKG